MEPKFHFIINLFILLILLNSILNLNLSTGNFQFVIRSDETSQVKLAVEKVINDCDKIMDFKPEISPYANAAKGVDIVILNYSTEKGKSFIAENKLRPLKGEWESHRLYASPEENRIYVYGYDMRGTIFAIYTFDEKILGVPPLWYWSSWSHKSIRL